MGSYPIYLLYKMTPIVTTIKKIPEDTSPKKMRQTATMTTSSHQIKFLGFISFFKISLAL